MNNHVGLSKQNYKTDGNKLYVCFWRYPLKTMGILSPAIAQGRINNS